MGIRWIEFKVLYHFIPIFNPGIKVMGQCIHLNNKEITKMILDIDKNGIKVIGTLYQCSDCGKIKVTKEIKVKVEKTNNR